MTLQERNSRTKTGASSTATSTSSSSPSAMEIDNTDDALKSSETEPSTSGPSRNKRRKNTKQFAVSVRWEREMEERRRNQSKKSRCTGTTEDLNTNCCCCAHRIGDMFSILETSNGSPIVMAGPCWPFCLFITFPLIVVISGLVAYFVVLKKDNGLPFWFAYIYFTMIGITILSLFCVSCRDPGLLERVTDEEAGQGGWFWNEQVGSYRPPGALYCRECKVLIQDYDHLCPWTGTGIGRKNMFCFKSFVINANIICYTSIGLVAYELLRNI